jgi:hypothetical protein
MPLHPNVRRCTHIQITGHRCGSPALKQEYFCYFHTRMIKGVQTRVDSQIHPVALLESAEAIQAAIMHTVDAVLKGTIDNKRAHIVLKALHIAVRNARNVYFHIRQDDMVREVPNFAEQYLTEHPELNPPEPNPPQPETHVAPDAPVRGAEPGSAKECHPEEAQAFAKRRPANEGSLHSPADPAVLPSQERSSCASGPARVEGPHPANSGNCAAGNSHHPPDGSDQNAWGENLPPLTTRQSERWNKIKKLEASIEGAHRGNWRDLRTVFNAVGLTPRKSPDSEGRAHENERRKKQHERGRSRPH